MPKATNFFSSTPQTLPTRGRPRKYPAGEETVRVTDLCKSVLRAFRTHLKGVREIREKANRFWQTFRKEKRPQTSGNEKRKGESYSRSYTDTLFKNSEFARKFKNWVYAVTWGTLKRQPKRQLSRQALLFAQHLAETR